MTSESTLCVRCGIELVPGNSFGPAYVQTDEGGMCFSHTEESDEETSNEQR